MSNKAKIIIDMDIGDDIDDAIALYAAMRQKFEIVGITTVFQNTQDRARQAKKIAAVIRKRL
jgi:purine nucleosidase/pyrimidine-specific ribonucleoside hydrolase